MRHPVTHYFIISRAQWNYIIRVLGTIVGITLLTLIIVAAVYYVKFKTGYFYYMTEDLNADLIRHNIWSLILPSFLPSALVALIIGTNVTLYSSRKIVLPILKIRKWAEALFAGNFGHFMTVRESDNLNELAAACNQVSGKYADILKNIQSTINDMDKGADKKIQEVNKILSSLNLTPSGRTIAI